jgi:2-C-methyl-D-erythritol 4-phosphate cytidylyltransferase
MNSGIDVVIVAAGAGKRLGSDIPNAFVQLKGKPLLSYSIEVFASHESINSIVIVVPPSHMNDTALVAASTEDPSRIRITGGGEHRWQSVRNGIALCTSEWVLVHDAARPFVTRAVIDGVIEKKGSFDCVITATPVVDTLRSFKKDKAGETVDRTKLVQVGTPQLFRRDIIYGILKNGPFTDAPTDEAVLMQREGHEVGISWGDPRNFKITTLADMEIAEAMIAQGIQVSLGR